MGVGKELEDTILELAYDLQAGLRNLEAELDKALVRGECKDSAEKAERPVTPSVISEIIDVLQDNSKKLGDLTERFNGGILHRLSKG